jgi:hypothetical protein
VITFAEARKVVQELDASVEWTLPPRTSCLRCGKMFVPTDDTAIRYDPHFSVFFFYCEEHAHDP